MRTLLIALVLLPVSAEEPWSADPRHPVFRERREAPTPPSFAVRLLDAPVRFYQRRISPHDGPRCPLYPTCSDFGRQALARHGALAGTLLTVDRLVQEGETMLRAPRIRVHGRWRGHDPVEANTFWWPCRRGRGMGR